MHAYLKLFLASLFWAMAFVYGHEIVKEIPAVAASFFRFSIASVVMVIFMLKKKSWKIKSLELPKNRGDWFMVIISGFIGIFLYNVFFMYGLLYVPAVRAATIIPTNPVFIAILAFIFYREPFGLKKVTGMALALIGALLVVAKGNLALMGFDQFSRYDLLLLGALICWVLYVFISKHLLKTYESLEFNTWAFIAGALFLGLLSPFTGGFFGELGVSNISLISWLGLVCLGVGSSALAYIWYFDGQNAVGVVRSAVFICLVPVLAMILSIIFLGEKTILSDWLGVVCVSLGIYLVNLPTNKSLK